MIVEIESLLFNLIAKDMITAHLDKKIKFDVIDSKKINGKFKNAVKDEFSANFLDDSDYIVRVAEEVQTAMDDQNQNDDSTDGAEDETTTQEETNEETNDSDEDDEKKEKKGDAKEQTLNESVKVQDLTKSMLTPIKTANKAKTKPCSCGEKIVAEKEKCDDEKECGKKPNADKNDNPNEKISKITEAETEATGDELKLKVQKSLARTFNIEKDKVQLFDLPDFLQGYNTYFAKITFKKQETEKQKTEKENPEKDK